MEHFEIKLLSEKQIWGEEKLEILQKRGITAPATDFAILLGTIVDYTRHYNNGEELIDNVGSYWTLNTVFGGDFSIAVDRDSTRCSAFSLARFYGVRPILSFSLTNLNMSNEEKKEICIEYGEYPQSAASKKMQIELQKIYKLGGNSIKKTGRSYTVDSNNIDEMYKLFKPKIYDEYEYKGKRYIRVKNKIDKIRCKNIAFLSNGEAYKKGDYVWIEVEPIRWLIDKKNAIALSEKILLSGIQFNNDGIFIDYEHSNIKRFLNTHFMKDIVSSESNTKIIEKEQKEIKDATKIIDPKTEEEKLLLLIQTEFNLIKEKIEQINDIELKESYINELMKLYEKIEKFLKEKQDNEKNKKLNHNHIFLLKKQVTYEIWNLNHIIDNYMENEKLIEEIKVLNNEIKSKIDIELFNIDDLKLLDNEGIKCFHLLCNEIYKIDDLNNNLVKNKIILLINMIKEIILKNKDKKMILIGYEKIKSMIIVECTKLNILLEEQNKIDDSHNRQNELLEDIKKTLVLKKQ